MTYTDSASTGTKESFTYSYDKNSNIVSERHINNWQFPKLDETRTYTYDAQGRLIKSVKTNNLKTADKLTTEYQFDLVGNRRYETENGVRRESKYNGLNQLIISQGGSPATTTQYTYDANGNQVTAKVGNNAITTYTYDTENRMTRAVKGTEAINTNTYRSDGQRITKTDKAGTTTNYFYQAGVVLYTTDAKDNKTTHNLLGGSDNVIASKRYTGTQANRYVTYNKDIRTSTTTLTDDTGTYQTAYTYTDYGETTRQGNALLTNEIAYTGGIYDVDTELYYLNARYYNPNAGSFISQDTYRGEKENANSQNYYAYGDENPIVNIDPTGHRTWFVNGINNTAKNGRPSYVNTVQKMMKSIDKRGFTHYVAFKGKTAKGLLEVAREMRGKGKYSPKLGRQINKTLRRKRLKKKEKLILIGYSGGGQVVLNTIQRIHKKRRMSGVAKRTRREGIRVILIGSPTLKFIKKLPADTKVALIWSPKDVLSWNLTIGVTKYKVDASHSGANGYFGKKPLKAVKKHIKKFLKK
jgi:RHS repeat-associated protein